jgi:hypothetical protein
MFDTPILLNLVTKAGATILLTRWLLIRIIIHVRARDETKNHLYQSVFWYLIISFYLYYARCFFVAIANRRVNLHSMTAYRQ